MILKIQGEAMGRLTTRLEKLEQLQRGVPLDMTEAEIQEQILVIRARSFGFTYIRVLS
jgi:hypothetical protein